MKFKSKLLSIVTVATIVQLAHTVTAAAQSAPNLQQNGYRNEQTLASTLANLRSTTTLVATTTSQPLIAPAEIPTAQDLVARTNRRKTRKSSAPSQPVKKPVADTNPTTPSQSQAPATPATGNGKQVLVSDIIIKNPKGTLAPELESRIRQILTVKPGQPTTREQLEQNLNAIKALGAFSAVEIIPEDTAKGVRLSFLVTPYGNLAQVQIRTLPATSSTVLKQADVDNLFKAQYGKQLNAVDLQAAIKQLNQLYQQQGYNLAQVVDVEELGADGKLTLVIAEGLIEDVQVRFLNKEGALVDDQKKPITGQTRPFIVTREAELKPGKIFNRNTAEKDLRRIYGLGIFDDVRVSFAPGTDPAKVVLQFNVIERKTSSIIAGGGISSTNGLFGSISYNQLNVGGNAQKLGAELQIGTRDLLYDLNFSDPWIATDPNRTSYNAYVFQRRSLSLVFGGGKHQLSYPELPTRRQFSDRVAGLPSVVRSMAIRLPIVLGAVLWAYNISACPSAMSMVGQSSLKMIKVTI